MHKMANYYLSYDVRGIQKFIFAVPNLRCIIGASELIYQLDQEVAQAFMNEKQYCAGGGGLFCFENEHQRTKCIDTLTKAAFEIGADIRIGIGESATEAKSAIEVYPYWHRDLDGAPCELSGLYPVCPQEVPHTRLAGERVLRIHPLIQKRIDASREDRLGKDLLPKADCLPPDSALLAGCDLAFFKNVSPESAHAAIEGQRNHARVDEAEARAGFTALGSRNRWAVIAMDGNDVGNQHLEAKRRVDRGDWSNDQRSTWVRAMSIQLAAGTQNAVYDAIAAVVNAWWRENFANANAPNLSKQLVVSDAEGKSKLVLPLRPLIVGGDDVILLCHTQYAMLFVKTMARRFAEYTAQASTNFETTHGFTLWPATDGRLTMSAGVLFCKTSYPLHGAIQYAESLLASAKGKYRLDPNEPTASSRLTPAAVDFDCVTDTLLDTPAARRQRDLSFHDEDLGSAKVFLTRRPYRLGEANDHPDADHIGELDRILDWLQTQAVPRSVLAEVQNRLNRPWAERTEFLYTLSRKHPELFAELEQPPHPAVAMGKSWILKEKDGRPTEMRTSFLDALILHDEIRRQEQIAS